MSLRVVFMGTPDFAVPTLRCLLSSQQSVAAVYCQPPRPAGRGLAPRPSPVERAAREAGLEVHCPLSLRGSDVAATFAEHRADVAVVVAYGLLLPASILAIPQWGCLNLHPSKLPRWRGAAPIPRTLMAGDQETAICIMRMEAGLDTGPVCLEEPVTLPAETTAGALHDFAASRGAELMLQALVALQAGTLTCRPQSAEGATYAAKIDKAEARIDWSKSASAVHNQIRGLSPFPGAWFEVVSGNRVERVKVLKSEANQASGPPGTTLDEHLLVACGKGAVRLLELQRSGRRPMSGDEFLRGFALPKGTKVG